MSESRAEQAATSGRERSPLEVCEDVFVWLVTGPAPLAVNGRAFDGLPNRAVPLHQLRTRLGSRRIPPATEDAIWAHLVFRARTEHRPTPDRPASGRSVSGRGGDRSTDRRRSPGSGGAGRGSMWTVACAGVALPVLVRVAANVAIRYGGDAADIEAAVLSGFVIELHRTDVCVPRIMPRLRAAAYRSAIRFRATQTLHRSPAATPALVAGPSSTAGPR